MDGRGPSAIPVQDPGGIRSDCWCLSKGMAGMVSQMNGLAQALGMRPLGRATQLRFPWTVTPTPMIPRTAAVLKEPSLIKGEPPRVAISCGRHGVVPSLCLKKTWGNRIFTVHIQDPKVDPALFDLVIAPRHDYVRGSNVFLTNGAIHYVTPQRLAEAADSEQARAISDGRPITAVLVGGPNGYYSFSDADMQTFFDHLRQVERQHDVQLVFLPSNRTPTRVTTMLQSEFGDRHYVWDRHTANPYFAALALASHFVVTGDSVSMVTEAASTGRPVFVHHLTERRPAKRFRRFHRMFADDGITRPFAGRLAEWAFEPPNDTPRVAQLILERIAVNEFSSGTELKNKAA